MAILHINQLSKRYFTPYSEIVALGNVSFNVSSGEFIVIV